MFVFNNNYESAPLNAYKLDQFNLYNFRFNYNTPPPQDILTIQNSNTPITIDITKQYIVLFTFSGIIDAQANSNSRVQLYLFGNEILEVRAYEPSINFKFDKTMFILQPSNTTPLSITSVLAYRIIGMGSIIVIPIL